MLRPIRFMRRLLQSSPLIELCGHSPVSDRSRACRLPIIEHDKVSISMMSPVQIAAGALVLLGIHTIGKPSAIGTEHVHWGWAYLRGGEWCLSDGQSAWPNAMKRLIKIQRGSPNSRVALKSQQ